MRLASVGLWLCVAAGGGAPVRASPAPPSAPATVAGTQALPACAPAPDLTRSADAEAGPPSLPTIELPFEVRKDLAGPEVAPGCLLAGRALDQLAAPEAVIPCCAIRPKNARDEAKGFTRGCLAPIVCSYRIGEREVHTREELARTLGPIATAARAIGVVSVLVPDVFVPISPAERTAASQLASRFGWRRVAGAPRSVEVEQRGDGFVVRVPAYRRCGCRHPLWRVAYRVDRQGAVCPAAEPPALLAAPSRAVCVD